MPASPRSGPDPWLIEWEDASGPASGDWEYVSSLAKHPERYLCRSVGWIHAETPTLLTLVPHYGNTQGQPEDLQVCGVIHIPAKMIRHRTRLRKGRTHGP